MLRLLLPRLALVFVAVPLLFVATALWASRMGFDPAPSASAVGALAFASLTLAPSHKNAAMRAALLMLLVVAAWTTAWLDSDKMDDTTPAHDASEKTVERGILTHHLRVG